MRLVGYLLATFAVGLIATGVVIGFLPGGDCGSAFSSPNQFADSEGCSGDRADRRGLPIALIGAGLSAGVAAIVTTQQPYRRSSD